MISRLLEYVRKTNPFITREKLLIELNKSRYSSIALAMVVQNKKQES